MEQNTPPHDYVLTLYEVCELLNKSSRTISRYVHRNMLHPVGVKSRQGTLEYRFSRGEVDELKRREMTRITFPHLGEIGPGLASFASMNYAVPPVASQTPFAIPGVTYPVAPSDNSPASPSEPQKQSYSEPEVTPNPPAASNGFSDFGGDQTVGRSEAADNAAVQIRDDGKIITLLKETTEMLRDQLKVKDNQIKNLDEKIGQLIERNRETNILLKGMQDKMVLLEKPKEDRKQTVSERPAPVSDEMKPAAAPAPRAADGGNPPVKVRVAYSDSVPVIDPAGRNDDGGEDGSSEWEEDGAKNNKQSGRGFFNKMFRQ